MCTMRAVRRLMAIGILLWISAASRAQIPPSPPDDVRCNQAYESTHYNEAAQCYDDRARAAATPQFATAARLRQAESLVHLGDLAHAEGVLLASLNATPESAETLYLLGYVLQRRDHPEASLKRYTEAAALRPPTGEDLRIVALDYVLLADYADARRWLERALAEHPDNAEAWYDLARVHMHDRRYPDATIALQRSLALRPHSAKAEDNLGICLEAENKLDDAGAAYARAIRIADTEAHPSEMAFMDYGRLLITRNAAASAIPLLKRAIELNPTSSEAFAEFSRASSGTGDAATALTAMERAVQLDPKNSRLHFQLGRLYRSAGMAEKAKREFDLSAAMYGDKSAE